MADFGPDNGSQCPELCVKGAFGFVARRSKLWSKVRFRHINCGLPEASLTSQQIRLKTDATKGVEFGSIQRDCLDYPNDDVPYVVVAGQAGEKFGFRIVNCGSDRRIGDSGFP